MTDDAIETAADGLRAALGPLFSCSVRDDGALHVRTPLLDQSNDLIDVYLTRGAGEWLTGSGGEWTARDFGGASGFLWLTTGEDADREAIEREARGTGVLFADGELRTDAGDGDPAVLAAAVMDVAIAAMRVTHLRGRP